ncbi:BA14K-like protein [Rhizobium sp. BK376]|nr:BA14K-like protein [Rhizobium sp. BK376]
MISLYILENAVVGKSRRGWKVAMIVFARITLVCVSLLVLLLSPLAANAVPLGSIGPQVHSDIVKVQTLCDYRGCFGFGPRQTYRPPTYRPPGYQPPVYYRPRATGTPNLIYQPPTTTSVPPPVRPATRAPTLSRQHVQWCRGKYRSYDPTTNRYRTFRGGSLVCYSPYR